MKKKLSLLLCTILVSGVSGCTTVRGPSGAKFDLNTVCNTSANSRCSPTVGNKVPLLKQQIVMELKEYSGKETVPDLGTYLGTIVTTRLAPNGEPGTYCGPSFNAVNPFTSADFTPAVYTNSAHIKDLVGSSSEASIQADLIKALTDLGVSQSVVDGMKSKVRAEAKKLSSRASSSKVKFVEYRIKESVLRELERSKGNNTTSKGACMDTLLKRDEKGKKREWQMYQALSGFIVDENTAGATSQSSVTGEFALTADFKNKLQDLLQKEGEEQTIADLNLKQLAKPISCSDFEPVLTGKKELQMGETDDETLGGSPLGLQTRFNKIRCSTTTASSEKYFVAIGVSFWDSPRFHRKSNY